MTIEKTLLLGLVGTAICAALFLFADVLSWGLTTMSDCMAMDFDPECYSVTENDSTGGSKGKMWWPHSE